MKAKGKLVVLVGLIGVLGWQVVSQVRSAAYVRRVNQESARLAAYWQSGQGAEDYIRANDSQYAAVVIRDSVLREREARDPAVEDSVRAANRAYDLWRTGFQPGQSLWARGDVWVCGTADEYIALGTRIYRHPDAVQGSISRDPDGSVLVQPGVVPDCGMLLAFWPVTLVDAVFDGTVVQVRYSSIGNRRVLAWTAVGNLTAESPHGRD